jgi:serralysin
MAKTKFELQIIGTLVLCAALALVGTISQEQRNKPPIPIPFCTLLPSSLEYVASLDTTKFAAAGNRSLYWEKHSTLRIYFFDGSLRAITDVMHIANTWASLSGIKLKQVYGKYDSSEIRICFSCPGYNSLVGKQSYDDKFKRKPTMCLQGLDTTNDRELFVRTVLHEFGHVFGLLHELQNPRAKIPWDTLKLYKYYDSTYHWKPDSVNKWVLNLYDYSDPNLDVTDFDTSSIMMYAVPKEVTKGGFSVNWPKGLSAKDKQFIIDNYH